MESVVSFQSQTQAASSCIQHSEEWQDIDLFATSDCHSQFEPTYHASFHPNEPSRAGGMTKRATFLSERRNDTSKPLLAVFDCGDHLVGTLYFDLFNGKAELRTLKKLGCNAICPGNHDWDNGVKNYLECLDSASRESNEIETPMSYLCCNITCSGENEHDFNRLLKPHDIIQVGKIKMGVFGVIGKDAFDCIAPSRREGLTFLDLKSNYLKVSQELKDLGCDIVVCLSHAGFEEDQGLVTLDNGADVIYGGHSHKKYKSKAEIISAASGATGSRVIWHQAPPLGVAFARLSLRVKVGNNNNSSSSSKNDDKTQHKSENAGGSSSIMATAAASPILLDSGLDFFEETIKDDEAYSTWLDDNYRRKINEIGEQPLGECKVDWLIRDPRQMDFMFSGASPLGRFLGHFVADFYGATIGMLNRGGIKNGFSRGIVKQKDVSEMFGNNDSIMRVDMKGCRVRVLCEYSNNITRPDDAANNIKNGFKNNSFQFSPSLRWSLRDDDDVSAIDLFVNGVPLDDNQMYSVAINDYSLTYLLEEKWFIPTGQRVDQFVLIHERTQDKEAKWQQTFPIFLRDKLGGEISDERLQGLCCDLSEDVKQYQDCNFISTFKKVT